MKTIIPFSLAVMAVCLMGVFLSCQRVSHDANQSRIINSQCQESRVLNEQMAAKRTEQLLNNLNLIATR